MLHILTHSAVGWAGRRVRAGTWFIKSRTAAAALITLLLFAFDCIACLPSAFSGRHPRNIVAAPGFCSPALAQRADPLLGPIQPASVPAAV